MTQLPRLEPSVSTAAEVSLSSALPAGADFHSFKRRFPKVVFPPAFTFSSSTTSHWLLPSADFRSSVCPGDRPQAYPWGSWPFHILFLPLGTVSPCGPTHIPKTYRLARTSFQTASQTSFPIDLLPLSSWVDCFLTPTPKCRASPGLWSGDLLQGPQGPWNPFHSR